jgi:chemotaxis response regulator CheB
VHFSRPSIDVLFESAADIYAERLMGIILTGANDDGAAGLAAVHRAGGVTIVQEPESAQVPVMALSALKRTGRRTSCCRSRKIAALLQDAERGAGRQQMKRRGPG